jgi:hypothetical protein
VSYHYCDACNDDVEVIRPSPTCTRMQIKDLAITGPNAAKGIDEKKRAPIA